MISETDRLRKSQSEVALNAEFPIGQAEIPIEYTPGTTGVETRYDRNFDTLLLDSIELLLEARDDDSDGRFSGTLARASIVMSLLLLETAANIVFNL